MNGMRDGIKTLCNCEEGGRVVEGETLMLWYSYAHESESIFQELLQTVRKIKSDPDLLYRGDAWTDWEILCIAVVSQFEA